MSVPREKHYNTLCNNTVVPETPFDFSTTPPPLPPSVSRTHTMAHNDTDHYCLAYGWRCPAFWCCDLPCLATLYMTLLMTPYVTISSVPQPSCADVPPLSGGFSAAPNRTQPFLTIAPPDASLVCGQTKQDRVKPCTSSTSRNQVSISIWLLKFGRHPRSDIEEALECPPSKNLVCRFSIVSRYQF